MRLIDTYANYVGVDAEKAFIDESFYPVPFDKYIVVAAGTGMVTKSYDHFEVVVEHLNLPVIQIGGKDDPMLPRAHDLRGKTTWNQSAYIIKNASLFLGGDSICAHMSAHFGTPSIVLWGGTLPNACGTGWNKDKIVNINPVTRYGCFTACHSNVCIRAAKCINSITPEMVLSRVAGILGEGSIRSVNILHNGNMSKMSVIEWVPSTVNQTTFGIFQNFTGVVSLRGDLHEPNLREISDFCNQTAKQKFVFLSKPRDFKDLNINPEKIDHLLILVDKSNILDGIKALRELTKRLYRCRLLSKLDHREFDEFKLDMLDCPPLTHIPDFQYTEDHVKQFVGNTYNIKTNRKILGKDGRFYLTFNDCKKEQNVVEMGADSAIINIEEEHLKEFQFLTIRKYV